VSKFVSSGGAPVVPKRLFGVLGFGLVLAGCSSLLEEVEQAPSPDIAKAIAAIKTVAGQYHLTGELQIAGPIKAPAVSLDPWVICLRSPSETRFTIAIFYKADALVSSREATIADHYDGQAYQPMPK
jgi:hypothetical protein